MTKAFGVMPPVNSQLPCVGITVPAEVAYPTKIIAGHEMTLIPGGTSVVGTSLTAELDDEFVVPRWVSVDSFYLGTTAVSEEQYRRVMGRAVNRKAPPNHPATCVFYHNVWEYLYRLCRGGIVLDLPTEAQWEVAARGPAVNMREVMKNETGSFNLKRFAKWAKDRFENFVFGVGQQPFTPDHPNFIELVREGLPFWGWRVYGTPSGRLTHDEAWYDKNETAPVDWGPANAYGLKCMTGNVHQFVKDPYEPVAVSEGNEELMMRGSRYNLTQDEMDEGDGCHQAAFRCPVDPDANSDEKGFRVAAPYMPE